MNEKSNVEAEHAKAWIRYIVDAGADEGVAQRAVALAALNGLFDLHREAALPPLRAREEIARIIDPVAFEVRGTWMELRSNAESCQNALQKADLILSSTAGQEWRGPKWQHVKRGSIVTEIARGFAQVAHHPIEEMTAVVIYRHDGDGHWWVRNAVEFDDGRFVPIPASEGEGR